MSCSALKSPISDITEFKLVNPPVAKAPEWVYFKQYASYHNRKDFAVCNLCYEEEKSEANSKKRKLNHLNYEVKYSQSTSKLTRHLKSKHENIHEITQTKRIKSLSSDKNLQPFLKKMSTSKEKLYKFMIMTYQPLSLVENAYFREWVESMSDNYNHLSRHEVKETFGLLAGIMQEQIKKKIANRYMALTGDKWSSIGHQGYLGLTCHYIDDNWTLQK
jgi:hypothetical protein